MPLNLQLLNKASAAFIQGRKTNPNPNFFVWDISAPPPLRTPPEGPEGPPTRGGEGGILRGVPGCKCLEIG